MVRPLSVSPAFFVWESSVKIVKVLNNNIAIATGDHDERVIVMGCGIAFQKKFGDEIDIDRIESIFTRHVPEISQRLNELVAQIPEEYFEATQSIISNAKMTLGKKLEDNLFLTLTDHIHFTIERFHKGVLIHNRLLFETKMLYPEEFEVALEAVSYLNQRFGVTLPEDEAAFIALHFVNAETDVSMDETFEITKMVQEVSALIRHHFHIEIDPSSLDYYRLILHLKLFATRIITSGNAGDNLQDLQLFELVKRQYAEAYACVQRIISYIAEQYRYRVSENEQLYLTIHIQRVYGSHLAARAQAKRVPETGSCSAPAPHDRGEAAPPEPTHAS